VIVKLLVGAGPVETTRFTEEPTATDVPASGASLITLPEGTVLFDPVDTVPTTRPAPLIDVDAAVWVSPTTFGTKTVAGPVETTRFTEEPTATDVPASGASLITLPEGTVLLDPVDTVPTTRPAPVIDVVAAVWVSPTTFGTKTVAGPVETVRLTDEPTATDVPANGDSLITLPEGTVLLDAVDTVPTTRPAPVIEVVAAFWVSPTTFGTKTCAGVVIVSGIAEDVLTS